MVIGVVNDEMQALLHVVVRGPAGQERPVEALIDTGFNGFLTLPSRVVQELHLPWVTRQEGELADGTLEMFDVHEAAVLWDGEWTAVEVDAVDAQPLIGMSLMRGFKLEIEAKPGGVVKLNSLG